ncbi:conserved hypothetical protein [Ricinus communis]|uniref:Uncharacterized protein n=1 Tax=Ricinus communis TaxID=3988 RepID=B9TGI9_RICCO|nr:conserved hypothetical protein [Ricinus communis]
MQSARARTALLSAVLRWRNAQRRELRVIGLIAPKEDDESAARINNALIQGLLLLRTARAPGRCCPLCYLYCVTLHKTLFPGIGIAETRLSNCVS